ncbi:MAG: division/cell wall cluster transcriptional repressor MraZ [Lachnospiraceae bacterium]|nr:division/cell wall cluster transcriptional repressor MraZ [Lachnospiraceae bacterium]
MFMGEYSHSIDAKGRLIIPAKFREQLGNEFVVTKGLDGCLFVYPNEEWSKVEGKFLSLPPTKETRKFFRFIVSGARPAELDKQGRVLLYDMHRKYAQLEKDVVLAGVINRIEIWDKSRWEENTSYDDVDEIAEHMAELGLVL